MVYGKFSYAWQGILYHEDLAELKRKYPTAVFLVEEIGDSAYKVRVTMATNTHAQYIEYAALLTDVTTVTQSHSRILTVIT